MFGRIRQCFLKVLLPRLGQIENRTLEAGEVVVDLVALVVRLVLSQLSKEGEVFSRVLRTSSGSDWRE